MPITNLVGRNRGLLIRTFKDVMTKQPNVTPESTQNDTELPDINSTLAEAELANDRLASRFWAWLRRFRIPLLVVGHLGIFCLIYWSALVIRFETWFPTHRPRFFWWGLPLVVITKLIVFYAMKNFHGWWRYVTFSDLVALARAATISLLTIIFVDLIALPDFQIPRSVILIDWAFTIAVLSAVRSIFRFWDEQASSFRSQHQEKRALLIGDDGEAAKLAYLINSRPALNIKIVGLVSLAEQAKPTRYSNLKVIGSVGDIDRLAKHYRAKTIYVPAGKIRGKDLRDLVYQATRHELAVNVVPNLSDLLVGGTNIPIRKVEFEDLLKRAPVELDTGAIQKMVTGKRILVTGAGGSIGAEICRQLIQFDPECLILAGRGENRIYRINNELKSNTQVELKPVIVNVTDSRRIELLFEREKPQIVFHAAAHKHVPLMEASPGEAIINNVEGTRVVADAARLHEVDRFVLVSTDKAVNPTSVMGCTKHLAERYCVTLGSVAEKTKFVVTRFGNVLGSEGSVVPLFEEQIRRGGPITVTDPEMTRFFMTIPEASQLVLQAAAMGEGGEIFVLEMGEPVKIVDLAKDMIRFAGLPSDSIDIVFTGRRPGEKLHEELNYRGEESLPTQHEQIVTSCYRPFEFSQVQRELQELVQIAFSDPETIKTKLKELVPEYESPETTSQASS